MLCAKKQWRVMACLGERSLSSSVLLQTALIKDCATHTTWLCEPMRKFRSWFHSLITGTLIHPLSCCKVEMLPQQLPSPTLLCSARHRWMCWHILLHNEHILHWNDATVQQWWLEYVWYTMTVFACMCMPAAIFKKFLFFLWCLVLF